MIYSIFLNLQSLFKLLPQDDHIYLDIAIKHPNCQFWFIQEKNDHVTSVFVNRIKKLFHKSNLSEDYFTIFSRMTQNKFFRLINKADIILDSLNWSGNNSSHEAISLNKPIITLPGKFMRGRHTYSILKLLDVEETIAITKDDYIKIAVKLANDLNFRNTIINKIKKNKKRLFNDRKPIKFLEKFLKNQFEM